MDEENKKKIRKKVFENIIIAVAVMLYFIIINFAYLRIEEVLLNELQRISLIVLLLSILIFEIAYHKDSGKLAITGIEILILALHTLTINHVVARTQIPFDIYILYSTYIFSIYYVLKSILIYTNEKRKYVNSLSDIHEIVSREPIKKEASKRKNQENA